MLEPALTEEQAVAIMTAVIGRVKSLTSTFRQLVVEHPRF